jgi:uncharacterized protein (TIGR03083 family)
MPDALDAIRSSAARLTALVRPLTDDGIVQPAYPREWTIADVLSHLGSGSVIAQRALTDTLSGATTPDAFNQVVWDEWNAKSPRDKVDDGLSEIDAYAAHVAAVPDADRARFAVALGPFTLDWSGFLGMRLNEQLLHEWDVAVALDPSATLAADGTALIIDNLDLIARVGARPDGYSGTTVIATTDPERSLTLSINPQGVVLATVPSVDPDLSMPAEAFIRLIYGRLDPEHTPATVSGDLGALAQLRSIYPGF